jgi:hypothetical protein
MDLYDLNFGEYGRFVAGEKACFEIDTPHLPTPWEYVFQNEDIVLRVDQRGPISAQAHPPKDILFFRRELFQDIASWFVWVCSEEFECKGFSNYFNPLLKKGNPSALPDNFKVTFQPSCACYLVEHEGLRCTTEIAIPSSGSTICMKISLENLRTSRLPIKMVPVLHPFVNMAAIAPWEKPEWFLKTFFYNSDHCAFGTQLLDSGSDPTKRRFTVLWSPTNNLSGMEISYEHFVGQGNFSNPESLYGSNLRLSPEIKSDWGRFDKDNSLCGYPPVNALQYDFSIEPGEIKNFRYVLSLIQCPSNGAIPDLEVSRKVTCFLNDKSCDAEKKKIDSRYNKLWETRKIKTPDSAFDRYVNEWLPLQLDWICSLDRGWPSGMRGTRDSANDFTALIPLDPKRGTGVLKTIFSCQRTDGWFPRQYSASGRSGQHDLRKHMDGGVWVIEFLYEYLCFTKNWPILETLLPWLDSDESDSILKHAIEALEFYLLPENIGEHQLCKIIEGDWLDTVNRAGLAGRGESVMLTNQIIIALHQMIEILGAIAPLNLPDKIEIANRIKNYKHHALQFKNNLLKHALNEDGYFNSVFNDSGKWLFSNKDPDGERRVYGPANWFSIISGTTSHDVTESVLKEMEYLRCDAGYRLLWPPIGDPPIDNVGMIGSGDISPLILGNGTTYNQGSHGFLARALAVAGEGNKLFEVLNFLLPYDQNIHPTETAMTPPYAVVNSWEETQQFPHRGGLSFFTGTAAYALRLVYFWMFGIQPTPKGLVIDPCIPSRWKEMKADFEYLGKQIQLVINNPEEKQSGVRRLLFNGKPIKDSTYRPMPNREVLLIPDEKFNRDICIIEAEL